LVTDVSSASTTLTSNVLVPDSVGVPGNESIDKKAEW
jgi:hypothetical protein